MADFKIRVSLAAKDLLSLPLKNLSGVTRGLGGELKRASLALDELRRHDKLAGQMRGQAKATLEAHSQWKTAEGRVKALAAEIKAAGEPSRRLAREFDAARVSASRLKDAFETKTTRLRGLKREAREAGLSIRGLSDRLSEQEKVFDRLRAKSDRLSVMRRSAEALSSRASELAMIGGVASGFGRGVLGQASLPLQTAMSLEAVMARVRSRVLSGPDYKDTARQERDLATLERMAARVSTQFGYTGEEVGSAMIQMGTAGLQFKDITEANLKAVLAVSKVGDILPQQSVSLLTGIAHAFELPISRLSRIGDVVQYTADVSDTNLTEIADVLKHVGSVANAAKIPLETVMASVAMLADVGVKGSVAATALKGAFLDPLVHDTLGGTPKTEQAKLLRALGIRVVDPKTRGMRPFISVMEELGARLAPMGSGQRLKILEKLFGREGLAGISELVNVAVKAARGDSGAASRLSALRSREAEIRTLSEGTALEKLGIEAATASASMLRLKASLSDLLNVLGKPLLSDLARLAGGLAWVVDKTRDWALANPEVTKALSGVALGVGGAAAAIGALFIPISTVVGAVALFKGAWVSFGAAASGAMAAAAAGVGALKIALIGSGIGLAIAGLAGASYLVYENWDKITQSLQAGGRSVADFMTRMTSLKATGTVPLAATGAALRGGPSQSILNAPITVNVTEPKATTAEIAAKLKDVLREVKDEEAKAWRARLYD
jgi:TP901 family phage tail tape measure protein